MVTLKASVADVLRVAVSKPSATDGLERGTGPGGCRQMKGNFCDCGRRKYFFSARRHRPDKRSISPFNAGSKYSPVMTVYCLVGTTLLCEDGSAYKKALSAMR